MKLVKRISIYIMCFFYVKIGIDHFVNPDYYLNINNLSHGAMTGRMIEDIEKVLLKQKHDFIIIYGDTNSTLAGAIAAKKLGIIAHHLTDGETINDIFQDVYTF